MEVKLLDVDYKKIESYLNGNSKLGHKIFGSIKKDDGYVLDCMLQRPIGF